MKKMKIQTQKGLEKLTEKLESGLEETLKERENLGLSVPVDCDVRLAFYNHQNAEGHSRLIDSKPEIFVNALYIVANRFQREDGEKLGKVLHYFDIVRDFLGTRDEEDILKVIEHPMKAIREFEKNFGSKKELQDYKDFFKQRGTDYDLYKNIAIRNAKFMRESLQELLPEIEEKFKEADLSILRHEMDHVDFFLSPLYLNHHAKRKYTIEVALKLHTHPSVSQEFAQANIELLKSMSEVLPLLEARASFFNYIKPDEWDEADFDKIKKIICGAFIFEYVEGVYSEEILDKLVSRAWSNEEMDRQTSNYLFYLINEQRQSPNAMRYGIKLDEVNYGVVSRILYGELPRWKNRFAENMRVAVEVIGNVYRDEPSRLKEANRAKTVKEFLEMCVG